jgi:hypothetical protein
MTSNVVRLTHSEMTTRGSWSPKIANTYRRKEKKNRQEARKTKREKKSTRFGKVAATNGIDHLVRVIYQHEE